MDTEAKGASRVVAVLGLLVVARWLVTVDITWLNYMFFAGALAFLMIGLLFAVPTAFSDGPDNPLRRVIGLLWLATVLLATTFEVGALGPLRYVSLALASLAIVYLLIDRPETYELEGRIFSFAYGAIVALLSLLSLF